MPFDYFCMVRIDEKFDTLGLKTLKSDLPINYPNVKLQIFEL